MKGRKASPKQPKALLAITALCMPFPQSLPHNPLHLCCLSQARAGGQVNTSQQVTRSPVLECGTKGCHGPLFTFPGLQGPRLEFVHSYWQISKMQTSAHLLTFCKVQISSPRTQGPTVVGTYYNASLLWLFNKCLFWVKESLPSTILLGCCSLNVDVVFPYGKRFYQYVWVSNFQTGIRHSDENSSHYYLELKASRLL